MAGKRRAFRQHLTRAQQVRVKADQTQHYRDLDKAGKGLTRAWETFQEDEKAALLARVQRYQREHVGAAVPDPSYVDLEALS
jgi:hypothetical protein